MWNGWRTHSEDCFRVRRMSRDILLIGFFFTVYVNTKGIWFNGMGENVQETGITSKTCRNFEETRTTPEFRVKKLKPKRRRLKTDEGNRNERENTGQTVNPMRKTVEISSYIAGRRRQLSYITDNCNLYSCV